jgi:hypothetical protein
MKYIKKFNEELKSSTYYSAADKINQLGADKQNSDIYSKRSDKLTISGDKAKSMECRKEWLKTLETFKGQAICKGSLNGSEVGNYYISLEIDENMVEQNTQDGDIKDGDEIIIFFYIGFVPADEKTYESCQKIEYFDIIFSDGIFDSILMGGITFKVSNGAYHDMNLYFHDHSGDFEFDSIDGYRALKNRFYLDVKNRFKETIDEIIAGLGIGADYGVDFTNILSFLRKYNVNDLIK